MKNLLIAILFIAASFSTLAQDKKPTKEQTMEYIKNYFLEFSGTNTYASNSRGTEGYWYKFLNAEFVECKFKFDIEETHFNDRSGSYKEAKKIDKYEIDISKTESLLASLKSDNDGLSSGKSEYGLLEIIFISANKSKVFLRNGQLVSEFSIPVLRSTSTSKPFDDLYESNIYKAFSHLRKLCYAPDHIKFD